MKENYTEIAVILDRSGSMASILNDTIGGFNTFIKEQAKVPGEAKISLYQFDNEYQVDYEGKDIKDAPKLTTENYQPRAMTALLDAMGRTITSLGARLANMKDDTRPEKVIVVVITDGLENSSHEFTKDKVFEMVKHQTDKYGWAFVYLGANQDAIATASAWGGTSNTSMTFAANSAGVHDAYSSLSSNMVSLRSAKGVNANVYMTQNTFFSDEDRKKQDAAL